MGKALLLIFIIILLALGGCAHTTSEKLLSQGRYLESEVMLEKGIRNMNSARSEELVWLCQTYSKLKKYDKLLSCVEHLEKKVDAGDKRISGLITIAGSLNFPSDLTVIPHLMRAEAFLDLGDYPKAADSARRAYELALNLNWPLADLQINWERTCRIRALGLYVVALSLQGKRDEAVKYLKELEEAEVGFSRAYFVNKEKRLALSRAYIALEMYEKVLGPKKSWVDFADFLINVYTFGIINAVKDKAWAFLELPAKFISYKALYETGNIKEAREGYDKLLANPQAMQNGNLYWPILFDRGRIYQREGFPEKAIEHYKKSIDVIEAQRSTINTEAGKIGFVGDKQKVYHQTISILYSERMPSESFEYAERAKSRALVDLLAANNEFVSGKGRGETAALLKELKKIEEHARVFDPDRLLWREEGEKSTRSVRIKERIKEVAPELSSLVSGTIPPVSEIQSYVRDDETLIVYYYHEEDLYAFVIGKDSLNALRLDGINLRKEVESFREALHDYKSERYIELSEKLYERLIKPVEHLITSRNLIIAPHGILHYLPFNAIRGGGDYLIDRFSVSFVPSASVLKYLKSKESSGQPRVLILGNPSLGDPSYDLKYAEVEAVAVSKRFDNPKLLLKENATETEFKKFAGAFNYIHLATHGRFASDAPLNSGLFLAKDGENDGMLTVNEIYSLDLISDLVTLSACETALGRINPGDDVVGLTRGFLYAGSGSIVASLWKVDDQATSTLMEMFYSNLKMASRRDALRDAQRKLKNQYRHPYFWSAFQLTGNAL